MDTCAASCISNTTEQHRTLRNATSNHHEQPTYQHSETRLVHLIENLHALMHACGLAQLSIKRAQSVRVDDDELRRVAHLRDQAVRMALLHQACARSILFLQQDVLHVLGCRWHTVADALRVPGLGRKLR